MKPLSIPELRERFSSEKITNMTDTNSARLSAVDFLIGYYEPKICDSDGVSECVRCTTLALARWMLDDLRASVER